MNILKKIFDFAIYSGYYFINSCNLLIMTEYWLNLKEIFIKRQKTEIAYLPPS